MLSLQWNLAPLDISTCRWLGSENFYERLLVFLAAATIFNYSQRPTQPFIPPGPEDATTKTYSYNLNNNVPSEIILDAVIATITIRHVRPSSLPCNSWWDRYRVRCNSLRCTCVCVSVCWGNCLDRCTSNIPFLGPGLVDMALSLCVDVSSDNYPGICSSMCPRIISVVHFLS